MQVGRCRLRRGLDLNKDQSYVLSVMGQSQLARTLFPVGEYPKAEVRQLASSFGLDVESKSDSQDLCFLGDGDYRQFLRLRAPEVMKAGPIVRRNGEHLGEHQGLVNYTIGQRKGLGVSFAEPLYVLEMDADANALIVGTKGELGRDKLRATRVNWVSGDAPPGAFRAAVKIRYRSTPQPARIEPIAEDGMSIVFDEPQRDITPGQVAVVYEGDICLGGGVISQFDD